MVNPPEGPTLRRKYKADKDTYGLKRLYNIPTENDHEL